MLLEQGWNFEIFCGKAKEVEIFTFQHLLDWHLRQRKENFTLRLKKSEKIKNLGLKLNKRVDMVLDCTFWWVVGVCFEEGGVKNGQVVGLKSEKVGVFGRFFFRNENLKIS